MLGGLTMAQGEIKSSTVAAQWAIQQLVEVDTQTFQNQSVEFGVASGIAGMEQARQTTNQMLEAVSKFTEATLLQANKFPKIADALAKRDVETAKRWERLND